MPTQRWVRRDDLAVVFVKAEDERGAAAAAGIRGGGEGAAAEGRGSRARLQPVPDIGPPPAAHLPPRNIINNNNNHNNGHRNDNVALMLARERAGLCGACAMQTCEIQRDQHGQEIGRIPHSIAGVVHLGRCLLCHPFPARLAPQRPQRSLVLPRSSSSQVHADQSVAERDAAAGDDTVRDAAVDDDAGEEVVGDVADRDTTSTGGNVAEARGILAAAPDIADSAPRQFAVPADTQKVKPSAAFCSDLIVPHNIAAATAPAGATSKKKKFKKICRRLHMNAPSSEDSDSDTSTYVSKAILHCNIVDGKEQIKCFDEDKEPAVESISENAAAKDENEELQRARVSAEVQNTADPAIVIGSDAANDGDNSDDSEDYMVFANNDTDNDADSHCPASPDSDQVGTALVADTNGSDNQRCISRHPGTMAPAATAASTNSSATTSDSTLASAERTKMRCTPDVSAAGTTRRRNTTRLVNKLDRLQPHESTCADTKRALDLNRSSIDSSGGEISAQQEDSSDDVETPLNASIEASTQCKRGDESELNASEHMETDTGDYGSDHEEPRLPPKKRQQGGAGAARSADAGHTVQRRPTRSSSDLTCRTKVLRRSTRKRSVTSSQRNSRSTAYKGRRNTKGDGDGVGVVADDDRSLSDIVSSNEPDYVGSEEETEEHAKRRTESTGTRKPMAKPKQLSDYEQVHAQNIERNNTRLHRLGFISKVEEKRSNDIGWGRSTREADESSEGSDAESKDKDDSEYECESEEEEEEKEEWDDPRHSRPLSSTASMPPTNYPRRNRGRSRSEESNGASVGSSSVVSSLPRKRRRVGPQKNSGRKFATTTSRADPGSTRLRNKEKERSGVTSVGYTDESCDATSISLTCTSQSKRSGSRSTKEKKRGPVEVRRSSRLRSNDQRSTSESRKTSITLATTSDSGNTLTSQPKRTRGLSRKKEGSGATTVETRRSSATSKPSKRRRGRPRERRSTTGAYAVASTCDGGAEERNDFDGKPMAKGKFAITWEERIGHLAAYKKQYGHCLVPTRKGKLGAWVSWQRQEYNKMQRGKASSMTAARVERLEELGFAWDASHTRGPRGEDKWELMFKQLKAYKEKHGNCSVPVNSQGQLGRWVRVQRRGYRNLKQNRKGEKISQERLHKLEEIGFEWDASHKAGAVPDDDKWEAMFEQLELCKAQHGSCRVPTSQAKLVRWVDQQRAQYRRLQEGRKGTKISQERINRLEELGFEWKVNDDPAVLWQNRYKQLKAYKKKYGDCNVKIRSGELGQWVGKQRIAYHKLKGGKASSITPARIEQLEQLGFQWDASHTRTFPKDDVWEKRYKQLEAYKTKHGDCLVPNQQGQLGSWVNTQRAHYCNLREGRKGLKISQERIDKLEAIGFVWQIRKRRK